MKKISQLKNKKELLIATLIISVIILSVSLAYVFGYKNRQIQPTQPQTEQQINQAVIPTSYGTLKGTSDEEIMTYLYGSYNKEKRTSFVTFENDYIQEIIKKSDNNINIIRLKNIFSNDDVGIRLLLNQKVSDSEIYVATGFDNQEFKDSIGNGLDFMIFKKDGDKWITKYREYSYGHGRYYLPGIKVAQYGKEKYGFLMEYDHQRLGIITTSNDLFSPIENKTIFMYDSYEESDGSSTKSQYRISTSMDFIDNGGEYYDIKTTRNDNGYNPLNEPKDVLYKFNTAIGIYEKTKN